MSLCVYPQLTCVAGDNYTDGNTRDGAFCKDIIINWVRRIVGVELSMEVGVEEIFKKLPDRYSQCCWLT